MKQLPVEVQTEFDKGNWVVKGSPRRFNQVDPDQGQERLNGTGKRGGGIVGITRKQQRCVDGHCHMTSEHILLL